MTSSFILKKLRENPQLWTYSLPCSPLGGMEDRYLRISGECHPDFVTVPIGKPTGTKLCVRRTEPDGQQIGSSLLKQSKQNIEDQQGYHRGVLNLYDITRDVPTQDWNPQYYSSRRIPWEADLIRRDYLHLPIEFNGTGIKTVRIPHELRDADKRYWSYGYSFTPQEDFVTGDRIASNWSQNVPPVKYDVTQLIQPWETFQRETEYLKHPNHWRDTQDFRRIV